MMNNMEFFKETGRNYQEAYDKIKDKYGPFFQVLNRRTISMGGSWASSPVKGWRSKAM
jgi:flagellar biosynthesis GTPase FlhF